MPVLGILPLSALPCLPSHHPQRPTRLNDRFPLNTKCELLAFVHNTNGGLASVRVRPLSSGSTQIQAAGGTSYFNGGLSTILSAVTAANLETHCSLADVTNLVQQGAAGGYSAQSLMQLSFQATETTAGNRYAYLAEITGDGGATATTVAVNRTLVNTAPTVTLGSPSGPDASGKYTVIATLSENSTAFTVGDLTLTNATATLSGSGSSYTRLGRSNCQSQRGPLLTVKGLKFGSPQMKWNLTVTPPRRR